MTEKQLSTRLQKYAPGVHWQRIENSVGVGAPDLNGCWKGKDFWFELKIRNGAPIRPAQRVWHLRRKEAGGRCFILMHDPLHDWLTVLTVQATTTLVVDGFKLNQLNFVTFLAAL